MKTTLIRTLNKRIPKKWWMLLGVVISIYIICTYMVTYKTSVTSRSDHKSYPSLPGTLNHAAVMREQKTNVKDINQMPDNNILEKEHILAENVNEKMNLQPADQNKASSQGKHPTQLVLVPPPEVQIPHLYFNDEGQGQMGEGVSINRTNLNEQDRKLYDQGYEHNNFNEYVSNLISVDRKIREARHPLCLNQTFPSDLPDTSVIICFLNEAWSVLVRSVHSVINTSPPHLLREIILVDDKSEYDHLKAPLEKYMEKFPKVKIIRNKEREGLIRSRLNGAKVATGQVLTFLDSHIECATGWLPPLLARIKENSSNVVWPAIPVIDRHTLLFIIPNAADLQMGVFTWQMTFSWELPNVKERETVISPIKSPTMAGGLFSIDREYFYYVGSYDEEMRFWGGENLEMSFRIWMCGGRIEIIPCSIIGHIFREKNVNYKISNTDSIRVNILRTAMVWMDQYKYLYNKVSGIRLEKYGNVSSRLELREKLKCKSFQWYLTNVYPSVFTPENSVMSGLIHSVHNSSTCLQATDRRDAQVQTNYCDKINFRSQVFYKTEEEEIRLLSSCLDAGVKHPIMYSCHKMKGNQHFAYQQDNTILHVPSSRCLQWIENTSDVQLVPCDRNPRQMWMWENVPMDFLSDPVSQQ